MKKWSLFLGVVLLLFLALPAYANIIDSTYGAGAGSFELGTFVNNRFDFMPLAPGATTITGWTVGGPGDGRGLANDPNLRGGYRYPRGGFATTNKWFHRHNHSNCCRLCL